MRIRMAVGLALLAALAFEVPGAAKAEPYDPPREFDVSGPYTHEASGMTFPEEVGAFRRDGIVSYNSERTEESAHYFLDAPGTEVVVTVYVYPVPFNLGTALAEAFSGEELARARRAFGEEFFINEAQLVLSYHPGAELLDEEETFFDQRGTSHPGHAATFRYEEDFFGTVQPVISKLYLFSMVGGNWMVKYRITYAEHFDGAAEATNFIESLPWTIRGVR